MEKINIKNDSSKSTNSGFYKASSDDEHPGLYYNEPKMNNFLSLLEEEQLANSIKKKRRTLKPKKKNKEIIEKFGAPVDLAETNFSIKNDVFFGWRPNIGIKNPFPLFYEDAITKNLQKTGNVIYKGFRPIHSYRLHEYYSGEFKYPYNNKSFRIYMNKEIKNLLKMNVKHDMPISKYTKRDDFSVIFDSFFESGNCDLVIEKSSSEFDIYLRVDSNTKGHTHWFYFRMMAEDYKTVKIRVKNMSKSDSIFRKGGCPYYSYDNIKWSQLKKSEYFPTHYKKGIDPRPQNYRRLHTLEFDVTLRPDIWTYVAYCPPYTFSTLTLFLESLDLEEKTDIAKREIFCKSESGVESPMLVITEFDKDDSLLVRENRPIVILTGRVHPGETCGSHMMHGMVNFLLSYSKKAGILRELFEFIVIPMLNTDGVILGNFRAGLAGDDLNRQYLKPQTELHPSIMTLLNKVANLKSDRKVALFLDLHGHSTKPNVFSYGPELQKGDPLSDFVKIFPKMISMQSLPFKFDKCTWKINSCKKATARAVFLKQLKIKFSYTIEASVGGYEDEDGLFKPFTVDEYRDVGEGILKGLLRFYKLCINNKSLRSYLYPKSRTHGKIKFKDIEHFLESEITRSDNYNKIMRQMNEELANAGPIEEGGSDSESSDEDIPLKKRKKFREKVKKLMKQDIFQKKNLKKKKSKKRKKKRRRNINQKNSGSVQQAKLKKSGKNITSIAGKNFETVGQFYLEDNLRGKGKKSKDDLNKNKPKAKLNLIASSQKQRMNLLKNRQRKRNNIRSSTNPKTEENSKLRTSKSKTKKKDILSKKYYHSKGAPYSHSYKYNTQLTTSNNMISSYENFESTKQKFNRKDKKHHLSPATSFLQRDLREQRERARNSFKAKIVTTYENHTRHRKLICGKRVNISSLKRSLKVKRIESDALLRTKAEYLSEKQFIADRNVTARKRIIAEVLKANGKVNFHGKKKDEIVNKILMKFRKKGATRRPKSNRKAVLMAKKELKNYVEDFEEDNNRISQTNLKVEMFIDPTYDGNLPRILGMNKQPKQKLGTKLLPYLYQNENARNRRQSRSVGVNNFKGSPKKKKISTENSHY